MNKATKIEVIGLLELSKKIHVQSVEQTLNGIKKNVQYLKKYTELTEQEIFELAMKNED